MNATEKVTQWVEFKIGKSLSKDLDERIRSETSSFDVEKYSRIMFERHFSREPELNQLKREVLYEGDPPTLSIDDFILGDGFAQTLLYDDEDDDDSFDFRNPPSLDSILADLQNPSEGVQVKALETLAASSAEDLVVQTSWTITRKILQDILKTTNSETVSNHVLELFRRFLLSSDVPKVVCEGFVSLAETIASFVDAINSGDDDDGSDVKREDVDSGKSSTSSFDFVTSGGSEGSTGAKRKGRRRRRRRRRRKRLVEIRIALKSTWLLVQSQRTMPLRWNRFNEKRLREIVFSFVHMLSASHKNLQTGEVCVLEILSVLDPKATWCSHWCHGATGRTLLCSALKMHRKLFSEVVDFILVAIKNKESKAVESKLGSERERGVKLPPLRDALTERLKPRAEGLSVRAKSVLVVREERDPFEGNRSAPAENSSLRDKGRRRKGDESDWIVPGISRDVVNEAKLCHCISMVVCLIQYRGGRSLFPLEVTSRRRRMTVPDFIPTIINYVDDAVFVSRGDTMYTDEYKAHMTKLVNILKSL